MRKKWFIYRKKLRRNKIKEMKTVKNSCMSMPEIMETEMLYICLYEYSLKHDGNGMWIEGGNMSYFTDLVGDK